MASGIEAREQFAITIQNAGDVCQEQEFFRFEGRRDIASHCVSVDIITFALRTDTRRRNHRNKPVGF